jgi:ACR3 family arsenite transporter
LATVVGVLVEVPVMLSVVHIVRRSRGWYEARPGALPLDPAKDKSLEPLI